MAVEFDEEIPKRDEGFWGLRINDDPVSEVIWCDIKPVLSVFPRSYKNIIDADTMKPKRGVNKLEVVKVDIVEIRLPELLAKSWTKEF